ncbi:MAG: hypothetical protein WDM80_16775 [Limisphaerales bacterium]
MFRNRSGQRSLAFQAPNVPANHICHSHINQEQYARLAERNGFRVEHIHTALNSWDFQSRENFFAFGQVTFVEWTRSLPDAEKSAFISDVLDRYATATADIAAPVSKSSVPHTFHFYQMDVTLSPV